MPDNTASWTPTADDVALLLRMRRNTRGTHQSAFTAETDPTLTEVQGLVQNAVDLVSGHVGLELAEPVWRMAKRVVALRAALSIEPGSRDFNIDRMRELRAQYEEELLALLKAAQDAEEGEDPGQVDDLEQADPLGFFPPGPCDPCGRAPGTEVPHVCYEW